MNLKQLTAKHIAVALDKGAQTSESYRAQNPAGLVPFWREPDGFALAQSLAIIAYLDEVYPDPPLLPEEPRQRAFCREIAYTIACDVHPIGNLRVVEKLSRDYGASIEARAAWNRHWVAAGFDAIEARLNSTAGRYAIGDRISLADICLVPQVYNARRYGLDLMPYPRIATADAAARELSAFAMAAPERQPGAA
jgi:maleylpyruvate isomerase